MVSARSRASSSPSGARVFEPHHAARPARTHLHARLHAPARRRTSVWRAWWRHRSSASACSSSAMSASVCAAWRSSRKRRRTSSSPPKWWGRDFRQAPEQPRHRQGSLRRPARAYAGVLVRGLVGSLRRCSKHRVGAAPSSKNHPGQLHRQASRVACSSGATGISSISTRRCCGRRGGATRSDERASAAPSQGLYGGSGYAVWAGQRRAQPAHRREEPDQLSRAEEVFVMTDDSVG